MSDKASLKNQNKEVEEELTSEGTFSETQSELGEVNSPVFEETSSYITGIEHESEESVFTLQSDESEDESFTEVPPPAKLFQHNIKRPQAFFELLGRIPDIEDISLTRSILRESEFERRQSNKRVLFKESTGSEETFDIDDEDDGLGDVGTGIETTSSSEYSDFEFDFQSSEEDLTDLTEKRLVDEVDKDDENLFENLVKIHLVQFKDDEELEEKPKEDNEEMEEIKKDISEYLDSLIEVVVKKVEKDAALNKFRASFDKTLLFEELSAMVNELRIEKKANEFLNQKCVLYYRRRHMNRPLIPEGNEAQLAKRKAKYEIALGALDSLIGRYKCTQEIIDEQVENAEELASELEEKEKYEISCLEELFKKTFSGRKTLNNIVTQKLEEMSALRKKISAAREMFIRRQHTISNVKAKREKLENITETLRLTDYEHMMNETFALSKKIEENTDRLEKVRQRFFKETHFITHIREKQVILCQTIYDQLDELDAVSQKELSLREKIFKLKTERIKIQKAINEKSLKCGLLDKPALLFDFDATIDRLNELKAKVDALKADKYMIEKKIVSLEKNQA